MGPRKKKVRWVMSDSEVVKLSKYDSLTPKYVSDLLDRHLVSILVLIIKQ